MDHAMFFIREYERCKKQPDFVKGIKELIKSFSKRRKKAGQLLRFFLFHVRTNTGFEF